MVLFIFIENFLWASEPNRLIKENRLLKSEYQLVKINSIYLFFYLSEKRIRIKYKGLPLKEFPIETLKEWGAPVPCKPLTLRKKVTFFKPKRIRIYPQKNNGEIPLEIPALGIEHMPSRYRLDLNEGVYLYIRPIHGGWMSSLFNFFSSLKTYGIIVPMGTLWKALHKKKFTEIDLYLSPKDAKALFWILTEGMPCLIDSPNPSCF
ncbi:MAG: hypothetical protein ACUVTN_11270 [Thermodesulfobacteriota bacterium]